MSAGASIVPLAESVDQVRTILGPRARELTLQAMGWMVLARTLDARMLALQRQGRVGFYGAATGHEAINVAAGLATQPQDWIFPGLREQLVALIRGFPLSAYVQHLYATGLDSALGRQMPCHPSAREVHHVSMSSVIGTQISQAVGLAYALARRHESGVSLAFFGDGATSSNDFHAGLNFGALWNVPAIFVCANNQWAISVPAERQTASESLAAKAAAYGLPGLRVDGTDLFQVFGSLSLALQRARAGEGPSLLEYVVYRMAAHTSSDDPTRYQPAGWAEQAAAHDPFYRLEQWLSTHGWIEPGTIDGLRARAEAEIRLAVEAAEVTAPPSPESLERDVFASPISP